MKRRIFLYYIILVVICVSFSGYFSSALAKKYYYLEVKEKLENTVRLIEFQITANEKSGAPIDYNMVAMQYAKVLDARAFKDTNTSKMITRITFIDDKGNVLGESDADYQSMENHLDRKEIQDALAGKIGEAIRTSSTLKQDYLYIAMPIKSLNTIVRAAVPLSSILSINRSILIYTLLFMLIVIVITALLASRFSHWIIQPINDLIDTTREIYMGHYSKRVTIRTKDEFGQLANTFNEMAVKLENTIAELTDKNIRVDSIIDSMTNGIIAIDSDLNILLINSIACEIYGIKHGPGVIGMNILGLTRNTRINAMLRETIKKNTAMTQEISVGYPENKILRLNTNPIKSIVSKEYNSGAIASIIDITSIKKLEQIRTEFVSNVTHELRTPLTSIRGFIETLRSGALSDSSVAEKFLEIIDIEAERLYMLINDILQLSEIESKQKDINIGTYNLREIIKDTFSVLQGTAEKKEVYLIDETVENIFIVANKDRIKQMLINLIDNGIKYNHAQGSVTVKAYRSDGKTIITILDTGIGISEEHLPRVFERFYRVDKGRSRGIGGTGLGLSIVKHIVNLYSGDIRINSTLGEGTEFVIQLPLDYTRLE